MSEQQWIEYANELKANPAFSELTICVVSVARMEQIEKTYLEGESAFEYGFTYGDYDFAKIYPQIREMLVREKANPPGISIKGSSPDKLKVSVVFTRDRIRYEGRLKDISISGLTCRIDGQNPLYPSEIPVRAIIITYGSTQFTVGGRIAGNHGDDDSVHLILFDEVTVTSKRDEIFELIHVCLQAQIEHSIKDKSQKKQLITKLPRTRLYRK
jgi:hypothetical protein